MSKIMLVEDDPMIAEIYQKKFETQGIEVVNATSGKEVIKLAKEDNFDLILLDMVLPEMNGIDVLKELKQSGRYDENLKVIVLSNLSKADHEQEVKENGAEGFIEKTQYSPSELAVEIKRILDKYSEQKKNKSLFFGGKKDNAEEKKKRILFIEDEEIFLEMFGKKLEDDGYEVEYAKNGAWGSKMAAENQYDLIITDMVMPAMSGDEIVRRIKLDEKTKNTPLIVLSASLPEEEIRIVKEMGVYDFYEKTRIVPSDLSRKVSELLKS